MQETTAIKVDTIGVYASRLKHATQEAQYYLAEKHPLPTRLKGIFSTASGPDELEESRQRLDTVSILATCLGMNASDPYIARLYLATKEHLEGKDVQALFRTFAEEIMAVPENRVNPENRKLVTLEDRDVAEVVRDASMGCTMKGTTIARLPLPLGGP